MTAAATGRRRAWLASLRPRRRDARADAIAGLPVAISSVPDGMAAGALAGVNPVHGLYASLAGPLVGGLTTSTRRMVVTTTTAASVAAGSAVAHIDAADRPGALVLLTLLAGVAMVAAGLLGLARSTRFVSHSVMIGFLSGVAINIVLGQLADLAGARGGGGVNLARAWRVVTDPGGIDGPSLVVGLVALALLVLLARTPLAAISSLIALAVPTGAVLVGGLDSVAQVGDAGPIPGGIPVPALPDLDALSASTVTGALAVAAIVLVQGAGVAEASRNPVGPTDADQDFVAQGAGNVAASLVGGMPVGGSMGQSALSIASGALSRWAAIWSGIWMLVILAAFSALVGDVAVPCLAAILIVAAVGSLRPAEVHTIWRSGINSQIAIIATFVATLLLPVAAAVGIGVVLSLLVQLNQDAVDLAVVQLVADDDGRVREGPGPRDLRSGEITVLEVHGSLFYAGARTLQVRLPDPATAQRVAVVIRLRGRTSLGATFFAVVSDYADQLALHGSRLYLAGIDPVVARRLEAHAAAPLTGAARWHPATDVVGASTEQAVRAARVWLVAGDDDRAPSSGESS